MLSLSADGRRSVSSIVVGLLAASITVATCAIIVRAHEILLAFFAAIVVGEALRPFVDRLSSRMPRSLAIAVTLALALTCVVAVWFVPIHALTPQVRALWHALPSQLPRDRSLFERSPIAGVIAGAIVPISHGLLVANTAIASFVSTLLLVVLMTAFWLGSSGTLEAFLIGLMRPAERDAAIALFGELSEKFRLYVGGSILNGSIVGIASMILLSRFGAPYAIVLGLVQGLFVAIPYLGTVMSVLAVGGVVAATQGPLRAIEAMAMISILEGLEGSFVSPLIFKQKLDVAPLTTLLATGIGGAVFGIQGVILAVPAASVLQTVIVRLLAPAIRATTDPKRRAS